MKLKEVIIEVEKQNGYNWERLHNAEDTIPQMPPMWKKVAIAYAKQKCKEQREICAANAEILNLQAQAHPDSDPITIQQINIKRIWDAPEPNFD